MSDNLEPISASEAARILSGQRWNSDEREQAPSEPARGEEHFGKASVERSQNFQPMRPAYDVKQAADEAIDSAEMRQRLLEPQETAPPLEINYLDAGNPDKPIPANQTVSPQQAASDLNRFRETTGQQIEALEAQQIADLVDQLRSQQQTEPVALDQQVQPQPEAQASTAEDPIQKALADPAILNAVSAEVQRHSAAADQVAQQYIQATAVNAHSAYANMLASFPEVANVRPDQLETALQVLARSNPEKAQAIHRHIETVTKFTQEAQRAQAASYMAQQMQARQQFEVAARNADADWENYSKIFSKEQNNELRDEAHAMLREYGLSDQEIVWHWQNNNLFRSFPAQRLMADAARWRLSQKSIKSKEFKSVPTVQRPGSPAEITPQVDIDLRKMSDRIDRSTGRDQIRAAAELVAARRRRG